MNLKQHKFITEFLRFGDKAIAYKNAYNAATANYQTLESAANRLLRDPEIAQAIGQAQGRIRETVEKEIAEQQKGDLLTVQKKRELLYQIATGEMHVLQYHKGKDCNTCTQYVTPSINHMLRAIHLDNKLAGHYPQKENKKTPLLFLGGDIGANAESIEDNGGGQLAPETNHENSQQVLSPAAACPANGGRDDRRSPVRSEVGGGVESLTSETPKDYNTLIAIETQQHTHSCHTELDSVSGETPRQNVGNHNIPIAIETQQHTPSCHTELDSVSGETPKQNVGNHNIPIAIGIQQTSKPSPVFRRGLGEVTRAGNNP